MKNIMMIDSNKANEVIENRTPFGLFYLVDGSKYIGIDNTTGDAWTEEFDSFSKLKNWLLGENGIVKQESNIKDNDLIIEEQINKFKDSIKNKFNELNEEEKINYLYNQCYYISIVNEVEYYLTELKDDYIESKINEIRKYEYNIFTECIEYWYNCDSVSLNQEEFKEILDYVVDDIINRKKIELKI